MGVLTADTRAARRPFLTAGCAALAAAVSLTLYLSAGTTSAYLAADDFQWLESGRTLDWQTLSPGGRDHFYRPVTSLWFAAVSRVCGGDAPCYHGVTLGLHAVNVMLVFALVLTLTRSRGLAFLTALVFGVLPAYVQALVWLSAVTAVLATFGILVSLLCQIRAWRAPSPGARALFTAAAVLAGALGVFAHEAAATLPFLSIVLARMFAPPPHRWRALAAGLAIVLAAFAVATYVANRENYVFREGHYAIGTHMGMHFLDYLVSLWVGPHVWWAYVITAIAFAAAAFVNPLARLGVLWMLVTLLPYIGFTWGNVGRYAYLPAVGMAMTLAAVAAAMVERARATRRPVAVVVATVLIALVVARFAWFTSKGARGGSRAFEPIREYVDSLRAQGIVPIDRVITVPAPTSEHVDRKYLEVMLRWLYGDEHLTVVVK